MEQEHGKERVEAILARRRRTEGALHGQTILFFWRAVAGNTGNTQDVASIANYITDPVSWKAISTDKFVPVTEFLPRDLRRRVTAHAWLQLARKDGGQVGGLHYNKMDCLNEALKLRPQYPRAWLEACNVEISTENLETTTHNFNKVISEDFENGRLQAGLKILCVGFVSRVQPEHSIDFQPVKTLYDPNIQIQYPLANDKLLVLVARDNFIYIQDLSTLKPLCRLPKNYKDYVYLGNNYLARVTKEFNEVEIRLGCKYLGNIKPPKAQWIKQVSETAHNLILLDDQLFLPHIYIYEFRPNHPDWPRLHKQVELKRVMNPTETYFGPAQHFWGFETMTTTSTTTCTVEAQKDYFDIFASNDEYFVVSPSSKKAVVYSLSTLKAVKSLTSIKHVKVVAMDDNLLAILLEDCTIQIYSIPAFEHVHEVSVAKPCLCSRWSRCHVRGTMKFGPYYLAVASLESVEFFSTTTFKRWTTLPIDKTEVGFGMLPGFAVGGRTLITITPAGPIDAFRSSVLISKQVP